MAKAVTSGCPPSHATQYHWMPAPLSYQPTLPSSYSSSVRPPTCHAVSGILPSGAGSTSAVYTAV